MASTFTLKLSGVAFEQMRNESVLGLHEALRAMLKQWHVKYLPRHFTPEGARMYGYSLRGRTYERRKVAKFKHNRPLEYTGLLRERMTGYMPLPVVNGDVGRMRYVGLPYYTKIFQKVSTGQIAEAIQAAGGDFQKAAELIGVSYRTIERRTRNLKDMHEHERVSKWRVTEEVMGELVSTLKASDPVSSWAAWRLMAQEAMKSNGNDIKAAANALGWSMSRVGKLLRNETYGGRGEGQTADKVKELLSTTDEERRALARIAKSKFIEAIKAQR